MTKIALIEDEALIAEEYTNALKKAGYKVDTFTNIEDTKKGLKKSNYDAWILDLCLKEDTMAGIKIIGWAKEEQIKAPTLVVSGLDEELFAPPIRALGVWDFVSKPVDSDTLIHKVKNLIEFYERPTTSLPEITGLKIDPKSPGFILWQGEQVSIPVTPFRMLLRLISTPDNPVSYEDLIDCVQTGATKENVRQHIGILRRKFTESDSGFNQIKVDPGFGYHWEK